jgi:putative secretion ATPase (PEP-CTERM system associated)
MYERFYNLRERPFSLSPDPDYLYPSRVHREALSYLHYGIEGHAGFIVITGEIGCGKTTLLQSALRGLDRQTSVSRLVNTMLDGRELIEAVMLDFGLDPGGCSKPRLLHDLAQFLVQQRTAGRLVILVIDEAQNLSLPALEEVRMLSNLETEKSKLIQIVLVGQPNLRSLLWRGDLEQLRQRVTVSYHLKPLDADDAAAYINHRLRHAALGAPMEFARDVTDLIHHHAEGIPRKINVIADAVLLCGYGEDRRVIDAALTREVIVELEASGVMTPPAAPDSPLAVTARQAVVVPPTDQSLQAAELARREAELAVRERQLSEQHRVMLEEQRLLQARLRTPGATTDSPAGTWPATDKRPTGSPPLGTATTMSKGPSEPPAPPSLPRPSRAVAVPMAAPRSPEWTSPQIDRRMRPASLSAGVWMRVRRFLFSTS